MGMMIDNMPAVQRIMLRNLKTNKYSPGGYRLGWKLGYRRGGKVYVNNHLTLDIKYHRPDVIEKGVGSRLGERDGKEVYRVVGVNVKTLSIDHEAYRRSYGEDRSGGLCPDWKRGENVVPLELTSDWKGMNITFTYDVVFKESKVKWTTRWDPLLKVSKARKHARWFSAVNSLMLVLSLTMVFGVTLIRAVRRDSKRYNGSSSYQGYTSFAMDIADAFDDGYSDSGWKTLRRDIFREPPAGEVLSIFCGSGVQVVCIALLTLVFATMGIISPRRRGDLATSLVAFYTLSSGIAGYVAARFHKSIGGRRWKLVTFGVAIVPPIIATTILFIINLFLWIKGSISLAPFFTMFLLTSVWLALSIPLAFVGTYFGYTRKGYDFPMRTTSLSRQIPPQPAYLHPPYAHLLIGFIPFIIVWIELRVILDTIWQNEIYHMFGSLFLAFLLVSIVCAECSICFSYMKLCNEDYHWWWDAFWSTACSGLYVFLYSVYYLIATPEVDAFHFLSSFLFLAYAALFSIAFALGCGATGLLSALWFVKRLYSGSQD